MNKIVSLTRAEEQKIVEQVVRRRESVAQKFPLIYGLFATFGLVATLYGFEKLIDRNRILSDNPWILLITGIITLLLTGAAYRKLS